MSTKRNLELRKIACFTEDQGGKARDVYYKCAIFDKTKNQNIVTWSLYDNSSWDIDNDLERSDPEIQKLMAEGNKWLDEKDEKEKIIRNNIIKALKDLNAQIFSSATHIFKKTHVPDAWGGPGKIKEKLYNKKRFINEGFSVDFQILIET